MCTTIRIGSAAHPVLILGRPRHVLLHRTQHVLLRYFLVHHSTPLPLLSSVPARGTARNQTQALLPNIPCHIPNESTYIIYPLDPCDGLHPFVTSRCSDFQDAFSPASSRDLASPGSAFNLCIGFVVLAQQVNIADCNQRVRFFHRVSSSFAHNTAYHARIPSYTMYFFHVQRFPAYFFYVDRRVIPRLQPSFSLFEEASNAHIAFFYIKYIFV